MPDSRDDLYVRVIFDEDSQYLKPLNSKDLKFIFNSSVSFNVPGAERSCFIMICKKDGEDYLYIDHIYATVSIDCNLGLILNHGGGRSKNASTSA